MKSRPILFSGPMVRAILEDRKTQTRRVTKPLGWIFERTSGTLEHNWLDDMTPIWLFRNPQYRSEFKWVPCPYGKVGDELWVKETWRVSKQWDHLAPRDLPFDRGMTIMYGAGGSRAHNENGVYVNDNLYPPTLPDWAGKTRVSIHMPRAASRITLRITDVRVERLQDISEEDAKAEGTEPADCCHAHYHGYRLLWESINGAGSWDANPFVWAVSFERVPQP